MSAGESVVYNWIEWIKESAVKVSLPAPLEAQLPAAGDETQLFGECFTSQHSVNAILDVHLLQFGQAELTGDEMRTLCSKAWS